MGPDYILRHKLPIRAVMEIPGQEGRHGQGCSFLTNHALVLLCVASHPDIRVRDIAPLVGITERATQAIIADLDHNGYLDRIHIGRRNRYKVRRDANLGQRLASETKVGELIDVVLDQWSRARQLANEGASAHLAM
jgi:hypothetical protein